MYEDPDIPQTLPAEHQPVFILLMEKLVEKSLLHSLQSIENSEAQIIRKALDSSMNKCLHERVLRQLVNAAAEGKAPSKRPQRKSLNLLSMYVMERYKGKSREENAHDHTNYWEEFLHENRHLIQLRTNGTERTNPEPGVRQPVFGDALPDMAVLEKQLREAGITGGFLLGIVNALLVIFFPSLINGYSKLDSEKLISLVPLITATNVGAGVLFGLLCYRFGHPFRYYGRIPIMPGKEKRVIALTSFLLLVVFKQASSRDAGSMPAPLGCFDFETIAYFLVCFTGIIQLLKTLRTHLAVSLSAALRYALYIAVRSSIPLIAVFLIYYFGVSKTSLGMIKLSSQGIQLFCFEYPHPERIILILTMVFSSSFIYLRVRSFYITGLESTGKIRQ